VKKIGAFVNWGLRLSVKLENPQFLATFAILATAFRLENGGAGLKESVKNKLSQDYQNAIRSIEECGENETSVGDLINNQVLQLMDQELRAYFEKVVTKHNKILSDPDTNKTRDVEEEGEEKKEEEKEEKDDNTLIKKYATRITAPGKMGAAAAVAAVAANAAVLSSSISGSRSGTKKIEKFDLGSPAVHMDVTGYQHVQPEALGMTDSQFREVRRFSFAEDDFGMMESLMD